MCFTANDLDQELTMRLLCRLKGSRIVRGINMSFKLQNEADSNYECDNEANGRLRLVRF